MSWTCPGHYKVHVHGRDSSGRPVHGHCPVPLPALSEGGSGTGLERKGEVSENIGCPGKVACNSMNQATGATVVRRPLDWQKLVQDRARPVMTSESCDL